MSSPGHLTISQLSQSAEISVLSWFYLVPLKPNKPNIVNTVNSLVFIQLKFPDVIFSIIQEIVLSQRTGSSMCIY